MPELDTSEKQVHTEKIVCPECGLPFKVPADSSLDDVHKHSAREKGAESKGSKDETKPAGSVGGSRNR